MELLVWFDMVAKISSNWSPKKLGWTLHRCMLAWHGVTL